MFLDSNVFIHRFRDDARMREPCRRLLERVAHGEQQAVISPMVLDEVVHHLMDYKGVEYALSVWATIRKMPNLKVAPIDDAVLAHVPGFIQAGLEPHDAFHAAVMKANGLSVICSYDKDFDKVKGIKRQAPK
mgnify:CR=1 FL=1